MESPYTKVMGPRTRDQWVGLTALVLKARATPTSCVTNKTLAAAAEREPQAPVAPAFNLWIADNCARDGRYADAARAYDAAVARAQVVRDLPDALDPTHGALYHKAQALALTGSASSAIQAFKDLKTVPTRAGAAYLQAGLLAEAHGDLQEAADLYATFAATTASARTDDPAEQSRRALERLKDASTRYFSTPYELMEALNSALTRRDFRQLQRLLSQTHFTAGALGGHSTYESRELLQELARDLGASTVTTKRALLGSNSKLYLPTQGWKGRWFQGDVPFVLTRAPQGWQWTGLGISSPNELWMARWRPEKLETNSPLPFELLAPWPEDQHFMAGGIIQFIGQQVTILGAGLFGLALAGAYSSDECGFGPRGYYYNFGTTHTGAEAFAIDFTRYKKWVPYDNETGGTPVLAARAGIVLTADAGILSGSDTAPNKVEIHHADPAHPSDETRFTSRYLHMEGPFKLLVSKGMPVVAGNRLGLMDDTGNSLMDHLHFSIRDRQILHPRSSLGASVRPTPMSGMKLEDGDGGTCIRSTNREVFPVKHVTEYAVQNWLITPAALAANEHIADVREQRFLLVLSGVAIVDVEGNSGAQWARETVSIAPPLWDPLSYAISKWQVQTPSDSAGYTLEFETEQWAPIVTLSSVWNKDEAVNSGFAVDAWRVNPWRSGSDEATHETFNQLFAGIQVDLAVRDSDAWIFRIGYNITLLGRIVYRPLGAIY
jgi:hypothetical protein